MSDNNGWEQHKIHVVEEIKRIDTSVGSCRKDIQKLEVTFVKGMSDLKEAFGIKVDDKLEKVEVRVTKVETKVAKILGSVAAIVFIFGTLIGLATLAIGAM